MLVSPLVALARLSLASAPTGLPIHWDTAPACVDAAAVPARVGALGGRRPAPAARLGLAAERRGERWRITLALEPSDAARGSLHRTLEGRDCATLTEAVALVVAVHLDAVGAAEVLAKEEAQAQQGAGSGDAGARGAFGVPPVETSGEGMVGPRSEGPQGGGGQPRSEREPPPGDVRSRREREPLPRAGRARSERSDPSSRASGSHDEGSGRSGPRAIVSLGAAGEVGVLPRGAAAFELAGGVAWERARVELGALASVGPDATSERLAAVGGRFRLITGLVRGCGVPARGQVELPLCAGVELGDLRGSGTGLRRPAVVDALWVAAVASARPQWSPRLRSAASGGRRPQLAFGALLDLVVPLQRHRFAVPEAGLVHAVDPVAVRLGLRVELRLP